jgi:hypothetical protein
MRKVFSLLVLFFFISCVSTEEVKTPDPSVVDKDKYNGFIPIPPMTIDRYPVLNAKNEDQLLIDLSKFPNQQASMTIEQIDATGKVQFVIGGVTAQMGTYRVTYDYVNYLNLPITSIDLKLPTKDNNLEDQSEKLIAIARVGFGLRLTANIITGKANVNIGNITSLGANVDGGYIRGDLIIDSIGMISKEIQALFPSSTKIDETSIQKALESIATIKSKIYETSTSRVPQIISVLVIDKSMNTDNVINYLAKYLASKTVK